MTGHGNDITMVNKNSKIKVLICMSGGVDSSVAAALLVKAGYDVTGAFMVNYDDQSQEKVCWRSDYHDALRVSAKLGIKLLRLDFIKEYQRDVLDYVYKEYSAGRTPNPDVLCNKFVKFGAWLEWANELEFDYIATGHYAVISTRAKRSGEIPLVRLLESKDKNKDQTYFLHQLNQEQLKKVLFPIGGYTKDEVRKLAQKFDLPTAEKEESMGICFVGEVSMREFLKDKVKTHQGKIVDSAGEILGEHDGLAYYTIGQRIGLSLRPAMRRGSNPTNVIPVQTGIQDVKPFYILDKNTKANELVVGFDDDPLLYKKEITIAEVNWTSGQPPKFPLKCQVRLRHRQELQSATLCHSERSETKSKNPLTITIQFTKPQRAVTPGQYAVIYLKGECLGGGVIL